MFRKKNKSIIMSYVNLRRLIGILGMLLPFICVVGGLAFSDLPCQRSISYYYHTNMRDFLVGLLIVVSMFLITYKGYERIDNIVTSIIGVVGLGIAFFPTRFSDDSSLPAGLFQIDPKTSSLIHMAAAALFFTLLAVNSMFLFTLSKDKNEPKTKNKKNRNIIYVSCGILILLSLIAFAVLYLAMGFDALNQSEIVLVLESVMLVAFGLSWLVKGETLFRDGKRTRGPSPELEGHAI